MKKRTILICDDEPDARTVLTARLGALGYETDEAPDGPECLRKAQANVPELVILDIAMPGMDGFTTCTELRRNPLTRTVPVVMLTAHRTQVDDRVRGLRIGADDYLPKDIDPSEFAARIETVLRRATDAGDVSPLTKLPGNLTITEQIDRRLVRREPFAVAWIDIDNFRAFNDRYGFTRGDKMILEVADALRGSVDTYGKAGDFLGHVGGDDFVVVSSMDRAAPIAEYAVRVIDERIPLLYDLDDRTRGYIRAVDRHGNPLTYPVATVSVAIVHSQAQRFQNVLQVAEAASETKRLAKAQRGSSVIVDRRVH